MRRDIHVCHTPRNQRKKQRYAKKGHKAGVATRANKRLARKRTKQILRSRVYKYSQNDVEFYRSPAVNDFLEWALPPPSSSSHSRHRQDSCCHDDYYYDDDDYKPKPNPPLKKFRKECSVYCGDEDCSTLTCLDCGHWAHPECLEHLLRTHGSSCPLCKSSIDHLRTDEHYRIIDDYVEQQFQADLEAAIAASMALADTDAEAALGQDEVDETASDAEVEEEAALVSDEIDETATDANAEVEDEIVDDAEIEAALGADEVDESGSDAEKVEEKAEAEAVLEPEDKVNEYLTYADVAKAEETTTIMGPEAGVDQNSW